ncbi:hypothetical protein HanHA300_Chr10g0358081 [Helianthus annuus]|nr:hypothetical protein HanHA300_Chr10g0358081 [Helianthus annuus]
MLDHCLISELQRLSQNFLIKRDSYKAEKMMVSLLQQAVKEDIFILLQHDGSAYSVWDALRKKFEGSVEMIKSKKSLLKKEFELFTSVPGETTKTLIERYCHLVRSMSRLEITKTPEEWVEKLADALPQKEWGTYLMILKNSGEYSRLSIAQFIEKLEGQDLEQQKIARMNNSSGQQDIKMYYKGNVQNIEESPKIQTAFSAENSSGSVNQSSINTRGFSSYPSVNPSVQSSNNSNGHVLHCNIAMHLQNGQNFSEEVAKGHMPLLATVEKGHFKRECTNRETGGAKNPFGNNDYYQRAIYLQVAQQPHQQQPSSSNANQIEDGKKKAYLVNQDDEKVAEGFS